MKANHTTDLGLSCAAFITTFFTYTGIIAFAINHTWAEYAHYLLSIVLVVMAYLIADMNTYPTAKKLSAISPQQHVYRTHSTTCHVFPIFAQLFNRPSYAHYGN